ncbi:MAG: hypothetical protein P8I79_04910 [Amylibacter sp.]|nr:hypothetical protein [Amylibacter sp.]
MKNFFYIFFLVWLVSSCGFSKNADGRMESAQSETSAGSSGSMSIFSRRNPLSQQQRMTQTQGLSNRMLVASVKTAQIEQTRDGGIIRARAVMPQQGYYHARLVSKGPPAFGTPSTLEIEFQIKEPVFTTILSTQRYQEIDVGLFLSNQKLSGIRQIHIIAKQNKVTLSR